MKIEKISNEIKELLILSIPIVFSQLALNAMGFVDTVTAGKYATNDLAAIAIGSSFWVPVFMFSTAIIMALPPKISFHFGANQKNEIALIVHQGFYLSLIISVIFFIILRNSILFLNMMNIDKRVALITKEYIKAVSWGLPGILFFQVIRSYLDSLNHTKVSMIISFVGLFLNAILNYIFVFGLFGIKPMGGVGCGVATSIVMWSMFLLMVLVTYFSPAYKEYFLYGKLIKPKLEIIMETFRLGFPIGIATFIEVSIFTAIALLIIPFGINMVAGHQIALNFSSLIFMIPYSLSMGLTVRVGQYLGQNNADMARFSSYTGMLFSVLLSIIIATIILIFSNEIILIYTKDTKIIQIAAYLLLFAAFYQIPDSLQINAAGALRGYKDTKAHMIITFFSFWIIALPSGYYLSHYGFGKPLKAAGFWISLTIGLTISAILLNIRLYKLSKKFTVESNVL